MKGSHRASEFFGAYYFSDIIANVLDDPLEYMQNLEPFCDGDAAQTFLAPFPRWSALHRFAAFMIDDLFWESDVANYKRPTEATGRPALACEGDVADPDAVAQAVGRVEAEMGPVDVLVNCAGIVDETPFEAMTLAAWDRMIAVHLRGTFLMAHAVWRACASAASAGSSTSPRRSPTRACGA